MAASRILGTAAADTLAGGAGKDLFIGGAGADTFVLSGDRARDVIRDFTPGEDVIDVSAFGIALDNILILARNGGSLVNLGTGAVFLKGIDPETVTLSDFVTSAGIQGERLVFDTEGAQIHRGGPGTDIFTFGMNSEIDLLCGFNAQTDRIRIDVAGISFEDIDISGNGHRAVISYGSQRIVARGIASDSITEANFEFTDGNSDAPRQLVDRAGDSVLVGTGAADDFIFAPEARTRNTIRDFDPAEDRIDLSAFGYSSLDEVTMIRHRIILDDYQYIQVRSAEGRVKLADLDADRFILADEGLL